MNELIGEKLGQYEIVEKIGHGGMALVFKAYQPTLDRFVAIKVLSPLLAEVPGFTDRFQLEARSVARLSHPNILPVYDSGVQDNYNYIVMRYVPNSITLGHLMKQHAPLDQMIESVIQVAEALNYTHEHGVIHRDVKPSNILIDNKWALLSDFGLVKDQAAASRLTGSGNGIGTAAYMSPEQARGGPIDHRTDIYSMGVILYEILSGTIPHDATSPVGILVKRTTEPPVPLPELNPELPTPLVNVVMHALNVDPDRRYHSASALAGALRQVQRELSPGFESRNTFLLPHQPVTKPVLKFITSRLPVKVTENSLKFVAAGAAAGLVIILLLILGLSSLAGRLDQRAAQASSAGSPELTPSISPTETSTSIPFETPQAVIEAEMEVRSGPGDNYELLGYLPAGARAEIISRDKAGAWWRIRTTLSLAGVGWIKNGDSVRTNSTEIVPIALAPPTSTLPATATSLPATATPELLTPESPTSTPEPATPTPEPTPTLALLPSATPTLLTIAESPVVTAMVAPPPTATPRQGEFILFKPLPSFDKPSYGVTEFEWQWTGPLAENQGFEVRVWYEDETPAGVHDAVMDNKNGQVEDKGNGIYALTTDITETPGVRGRRGVYNWTVVLVQVSPEYKDLGIQASSGRFRFEPIRSGGDGGDSDQEGGGAFN